MLKSEPCVIKKRDIFILKTIVSLIMRFVALLLGTVLLSWACFETRPIEPPSSSSSDWVSPTDYNILLDNLKKAMAAGNVQNYLRCFDQEEFLFEPAGSLFNNNETVWQNWSLLDDQAYLENMIADFGPSGNSLSLLEADLQDVSADSLRYVGEYSLRINHEDTTLTTLFKGQLQFLIRLNTFNEWEIEKWADIETHTDSSWSLLKLRFIQ
jgi:hypothetical protein